jgi:predicted ATPase/class 3 adenylate cyclase
METVSAYIPIDRRLALAAGEDLPEQMHGTALFADISGFTPLTEMLARQLGARRGAEELTRQLNRVYDALITVLHGYGGSVIGFSGDAITCWLDEDDGPRGTATAVAMQTAMQEFRQIQFGAETVSLGLKTAVVHGPVRRFIIGDPTYLLLDVMAGQTLHRLAGAEHQAEKGDVIVDALIAHTLGSALQIQEWRTDHDSHEAYAVVAGYTADVPPKPWPTISEDALPDAQARAWLLPNVYRRLQAAQGAYLAELRPAAALFLRFGGIDYDADPDAPQKLDTYIRGVSHILARYEGSLLQLTIGDKGSYLYASMGAPIAHEDNVDRHLRAAWEIQAMSSQLSFIEPVQIGVTYGRMFSGAYGGRARRTYGVLGDAVNLSARLMQAAQPGQILVNDDAFHKASDSFLWEILPAIRVKGKSDPIMLNRLVGIQSHRALRSLNTLYPAPPVGRAEIMAQMDQALARLNQGKGQIIRLVGDAGIGKTHLAAEFSRHAQAQTMRVALGACHSLTRNTLYQPWRDMFYALLELDDSSESNAIAQLTAYVEQVHPDWKLRLPLLGDLLNLPLPDNPTTMALESDLRQKALFSLLVEMVQRWAEAQPLVLILDNAHWMDEASLMLTQLLGQQAAGTAPVLLLLLSRPEQVGSPMPLPDLLRLPYLTTILLDEMKTEQTQVLLEQFLEGQVAPLLLSVVQTLAHGNPFFVRELVLAMQVAGKIGRYDGIWQLSPELLHVLQRADFVTQVDGRWLLKPNVDLSSVKMGLPDSIHGMVLAHLDRLPESHKLTLKISSVLGYYIDLVLVAEVHPENKDVAQIELEAAYMEAEEVVHEQMPDRKIYAFRQQTTQEVAYETLLHEQRQQLHRLVAQALAEQQPDAVAEIAHHALMAELWPLALRYNLLAGERAKQLYANQQAIDFLQKALRSAQALPDSQTMQELKQIHVALGELFVTTSQYDEAHKHLAAGLALAQAMQDWQAQAVCYRWYGRSYERRGEYKLALAWLGKGFKMVNGRTSLEEAEMSLIAGLVNYRQANFAEAMQFCQRSLRVGQVLNDAAIRARTYNLMGIVKLRQDSSAAIVQFEESLAQYEQLQNVYGQATSHNLIANGQFALGLWTQAAEHYRQSLDHFTQIGSMYSQVLVNNNLGGIALKQGRLEAALGYYQRAIRLLEQTGGSLWVFGALHLNMGHTYLRQKALAEADGALQMAQAYFDQAQQRDLLPELYGLLAELAWRQGDLVEAEVYGRQAVVLAQELEMPREEGHNLCVMGQVLQAQQQLDEAQHYFAQSYEVLTAAGDRYEAAKTQLALAQFYGVYGRIAEAQQALALCEPLFTQLDAQLDLQQVDRLQTELLNHSPPATSPDE